MDIRKIKALHHLLEQVVYKTYWITHTEEALLDNMEYDSYALLNGHSHKCPVCDSDLAERLKVDI